MKILLTGASGLVGSTLCRTLVEEGHSLVALARRPERCLSLPLERVIPWEATSGPPPSSALEEAEAVVHLAGESIATGRWTPERRRAIRESRVLGTRHLVEAMERCSTPPALLLSASAIGYYGARGDEILEETSAAGQGFLAETCIGWEEEAKRAASMGLRVVLLRTGVVLAREGGALARLLPVFQWGLGGPLGSGRQWMSWIHVQDEVSAISFALEATALEGPLNLSAPEPVRNTRFSRTLGRVLGRPAFFRVPAFFLRLVLGEMARELLLGGQRVLPRRLEAAGFHFQYRGLEQALGHLLERGGTS